jgi:uncharacterized protein (DUF2252 family)
VAAGGRAISEVILGLDQPRASISRDGVVEETAKVVQLSPLLSASQTHSAPAVDVLSVPEPWPWPGPVAPLKSEPWQYLGPYDPTRSGLEALPLRRDQGKALREKVPYQMHALWASAPNRPDPVAVLMKTNEGRQQEFVPIRMGRMAASPFGFLRGACAMMAWDLAHTQVTGLTVIMDGDAHLNNFGFYGTPQRDVVFDLNDFDEGTVGPWEWDLKRLVASVNVAARENGLDKDKRREAVMKAVWGYRFNARRLRSFGVLEAWYLHTFPGHENPVYEFHWKTKAAFAKAIAKAQRKTNATLLLEACHQDIDGRWRFREDPPALARVDAETEEKVIGSLVEYCDAITVERRFMLKRYRAMDIVHRIVGVGSVGTRAYLVLLFGSGEKGPLFIQIKEAAPAAHAPYLPPLPPQFHHKGRRIVAVQRILQSSIDVLLGTTTIDGRPFYVRQMKNMKASVSVEGLTGVPFNGVRHGLRGDPCSCAYACRRWGQDRGLLWKVRGSRRSSCRFRGSLRRSNRERPCSAGKGDQGRQSGCHRGRVAHSSAVRES